MGIVAGGAVDQRRQLARRRGESADLAGDIFQDQQRIRRGDIALAVHIGEHLLVIGQRQLFRRRLQRQQRIHHIDGFAVVHIAVHGFALYQRFARIGQCRQRLGDRRHRRAVIVQHRFGGCPRGLIRLPGRLGVVQRAELFLQRGTQRLFVRIGCTTRRLQRAHRGLQLRHRGGAVALQRVRLFIRFVIRRFVGLRRRSSALIHRLFQRGAQRIHCLCIHNLHIGKGHGDVFIAQRIRRVAAREHPANLAPIDESAIVISVLTQLDRNVCAAVGQL